MGGGGLITNQAAVVDIWVQVEMVKKIGTSATTKPKGTSLRKPSVSREEQPYVLMGLGV